VVGAVFVAHGRNASCDEQRQNERRQKQKPLDHFDSSSLFIATIKSPHSGHRSPKYPVGSFAKTADLKTCANFPHGQTAYPLAICSGVSCAVIAAPWLSVPSLRLSLGFRSPVTPAGQRWSCPHWPGFPPQRQFSLVSRPSSLVGQGGQ